MTHTSQPEKAPHHIDDKAIVQALSYPRTPYFITTDLYWDCECEHNFIRPSDMPMCENCGTFKEDAPPSRINEMKDLSIHIDLNHPNVRETLAEYSTLYREA